MTTTRSTYRIEQVRAEDFQQGGFGWINGQWRYSPESLSDLPPGVHVSWGPMILTAAITGWRSEHLLRPREIAVIQRMRNRARQWVDRTARGALTSVMTTQDLEYMLASTILIGGAGQRWRKVRTNLWQNTAGQMQPGSVLLAKFGPLTRAPEIR